MFKKTKKETQSDIQKSAESIVEGIGKDGDNKVIQEVANLKDIEIHVMPDKFLPQIEKTKMNPKKKMIFFIIFFIIFLVLVLGIMLYIASSNIKKE